MRADGFTYWKNRIENARELYDLVRIDHFRGLDRFWAIPSDSATAKNGEWVNAPGREIFSKIGVNGIIAEDLGVLDDGVKSLLKDLDLPGMRILSFAFDSDDNNYYLPWNVEENSVVYTGTHDNDTLVGLIKSLDKGSLEKIKNMIARSLDYLGIYKPLKGVKAICDAIIEIGFACRSKIMIAPLQDYLYLDTDYRINYPGTIGWWKVRIKESVLTENLEKRIKRLAKRFGRL